LGALDELYQNGYVHSNVRVTNLLFPADGTDAKLISFDMSDCIDSKYPSGHDDATAGASRSIVHDRYVVIRIIEKEKFYESVLKKVLEIGLSPARKPSMAQ